MDKLFRIAQQARIEQLFIQRIEEDVRLGHITSDEAVDITEIGLEILEKRLHKDFWDDKESLATNYN